MCSRKYTEAQETCAWHLGEYVAAVLGPWCVRDDDQGSAMLLSYASLQLQALRLHMGASHEKIRGSYTGSIALQSKV